MVVKTSVSIDAPPHVVREVFLDFPRLSSWHTEHIKSIRVVDAGKRGLDLVPGDKVKADMGMGFDMTPIIRENTKEKFIWYATIPYVFTAVHQFIFAAHPSGDPNKTHFAQEEEFTGLLGGLAGSGEKTSPRFQILDRDLKVEAERLWKERLQSSATTL